MPKPQAKIGTILDLLQKNPEATRADLAELEAATQPRRPPVIRASTLSERLRDKYYDLFESVARHPIGRLADALGVSDLQGIANERATGGKLMMASGMPPPGGGKWAKAAKAVTPTGANTLNRLSAEQVDELGQDIVSRVDLGDARGRGVRNYEGEDAAGAFADHLQSRVGAFAGDLKATLNAYLKTADITPAHMKRLRQIILDLSSGL